MKIKIFYSILAVCIMIAFASCSGHSLKNGTKPQMEETENIRYNCPMHSEVIHNRPGNCPICGRDLKEKVNFKLFE